MFGTDGKKDVEPARLPVENLDLPEDMGDDYLWRHGMEPPEPAMVMKRWMETEAMKRGAVSVAAEKKGVILYGF